MNPVLLDVRDLNVRHHTASGTLTAVDAASFHIGYGETLALIGESGCGKTSLGKTLAGLQKADSGEILFHEVNLAPLSRRKLRPWRQAIQMVFQDPLSALDPRQRAYKAVDLPLRLHTKLDRAGRRARIRELFDQVGLDTALLQRFPHQLSGGQRQRLNIARALAPAPELIVCDEPVSALDVSLQAQIVALLGSLQRRTGVSFLFISHDLSVVEHIAGRIAVMYLGQIVEILPKDRLWTRAAHPYTRLLLNSIPGASPDERRLHAIPPDDMEPPSPYALPAGCRFQQRCPLAQPVCRTLAPQLLALDKTQSVACHLHNPAVIPPEPANIIIRSSVS